MIHIFEHVVITGSMAAIVGGFINWPTSAPAGAGFHYTNENFMLLSYLVEKISDLSFREYLQTYIFDVIGLEDTYYDPWQSSLGPMDPAVGEEYRDYHDMSVSSDVSESYYASSVCSDEFNTGAFCGTGGMVSTTSDMHTWYSNLFIDYNPKLLSRAAIDTLIAPIQLTSTTDTYESYFGQGVGTDVYIGANSPFVIYYTGGMYCASTSIRMLTATDTDPAIATAFRNNVVVDATSDEVQESLNTVAGTFYDIAYFDYEWETFGDSREIVKDLASYFQANSESTSGSSDDDDADGVVIAVTVGCIFVVLGLGAGFLFVHRPGRQMAMETDSRARESTLKNPILPPSEDDNF
jgi:CubicO group peptidase (beta-lactamase class C family)